ncbi:hypothetical protein EFL81_10210 [Weissella confusa]|uniref:hypothetical protein n=1 Tax=Weissella confusa TaxID=1583 RepID=UPI00223BFEC6|nr:hypothetical protein [Weissella confusa]MCS9991191.1 hypothetical protein [Weissella confusa]MCS9997178.1 hypothetical protein [Weissella confusa]
MNVYVVTERNLGENSINPHIFVDEKSAIVFAKSLVELYELETREIETDNTSYWYDGDCDKFDIEITETVIHTNEFMIGE